MKKTTHSECEMVKAVQQLESGVAAEVVSREVHTSITLDNLCKLFVWKKFHELTEYIRSVVHCCLGYFEADKLRNEFKSFPLHYAHN